MGALARKRNIVSRLPPLKVPDIGISTPQLSRPRTYLRPALPSWYMESVTSRSSSKGAAKVPSSETFLRRTRGCFFVLAPDRDMIVSMDGDFISGLEGLRVRPVVAWSRSHSASANMSDVSDGGRRRVVAEAEDVLARDAREGDEKARRILEKVFFGISSSWKTRSERAMRISDTTPVELAPKRIDSRPSWALRMQWLQNWRRSAEVTRK
mmetsp:Transcript_6131/g.11321  ORF Transcript_6131/g.11321 Transcript_6131/m.11321 type:complete len:210 (+) Transcript_6131:1392-2021(+)